MPDARRGIKISETSLGLFVLKKKHAQEWRAEALGRWHAGARNVDEA